MPEIVEVRTDAEDLDFYLSYRNLEEITFCNDLFKNKCKGIEELNNQLPLQIECVMSKAKKIFIKLISINNEQTNNRTENQNTWWLIITYGMTGKISINKRKHSHIYFKMSESYIGFTNFYYENARRIGYVIATNDPNEYKSQLYDMNKQFALEYSVEGFGKITLKEFIENIKKAKNTYLVKSLMDQRTLGSGIGNYLLSEIMYDVKLNPDIKCSELNDNDIQKLYESIEKIILLSYEYGGVSMRDYTHINETHGSFEKQLKVYDKDGSKDEYGRIIKVKLGKHGRNIWYV